MKKIKVHKVHDGPFLEQGVHGRLGLLGHERVKKVLVFTSHYLTEGNYIFLIEDLKCTLEGLNKALKLEKLEKFTYNSRYDVRDIIGGPSLVY